MSVLVLTGPHASGKNTVAEHLARSLNRCAVVDADAIRNMVVQPAPEPWDGRDGERQPELVVRNACALARIFHEEGFDTVVTDVLSEATVKLYRDELGDLNPIVVLLLPTEDEIASRLLSRPDYLSEGESEWVYAQQAEFSAYDHKIDNTMMSPEEAARALRKIWTGQDT